MVSRPHMEACDNFEPLRGFQSVCAIPLPLAIPISFLFIPSVFVKKYVFRKEVFSFFLLCLYSLSRKTMSLR